MDRIFKLISEVFKLFSGLLIGVTVLLNFAAVIMRYFFHAPIMWCEEVSLLMFVTSISFSLIPMTYHRRAVKLDFFTDMMGEITKKICRITVDAASCIGLGITAKLGIDLIARSQYRVTPILKINYKWIYSSMVLGMTVSALIFLWFFFVDLKSFKQVEG